MKHLIRRQRGKRTGRSIASLVYLSLVISPQAATVVHDPTTMAQVVTGVGHMSNILNVTTQVEGRLTELKSAFGTNLQAISTPILAGLQLFGRCENPFSQLKSAFLGLGKISPSFDFCNFLEGQRAYTNLLFIPLEQLGQPVSHQKHQEIVQTRQHIVQQASVNTLAMAAQQKQSINDMRRRIVELSKSTNASPNMREDLRTNNQLLTIIANELVNIRMLMISQAEVQASLAANKVPVTFNPGLGGGQ